jgi:Ice-binding-like
MWIVTNTTRAARKVASFAVNRSRNASATTGGLREQVINYEGMYMNRFESITKPLKWSIALLLAALLVGCGDDPVLGMGGGSASASASPVPLGAAGTFGIAATAGVTNTATAPNTTINGDVVLDPTLTCNAAAVPGGAGTAGFGLCGGSPPTLAGTVIITGPTATTVKADMNAAFLSITPPAGPPAAGSLGGATNLPAGTTLGNVTGSALVPGDNLFYPGVYQSLTSILITDDLTLDAQGDANAVFIFQSSSTVGTADGAAPPAGVRTRILLVNGARASNVFWQAASSATLGLYSEFQGNILAATSITMNTGATSCGRLFAGAWVGGGGAFVFDSNVVSVPGQPFAPPATYSTTCQ